MNKKIIFSFILGILIGGFIINYLQDSQNESDWVTENLAEEHDHDEDVHIHADFIVFLNGEKKDFTKPEYQSTAESLRSEVVHLHDEKGDVIHIHAEGVTLKEFFTSLDYELTNNCFVTDKDESFCSEENNKLSVYVNNQVVTDVENYVIKDLDQILIYHGNNQNETDNLLNEISDISCMYSGSCPERGTPPPEECGLTCEL